MTKSLRHDIIIRMELYQLRTFITVAETGNLSRAAEILNASQPAVSAQIKALETVLGTLLFKRTGKGMELTQTGAQIRALAEKVLASVRDLEDFGAKNRIHPAHVYHIAINTEPAILRMDELANAVMADTPGTSIEFSQNSTSEIIRKILESKIDGGFVFGNHKIKNVGLKLLSSIDLVIACPSTWKQKVDEAPIREILALPWIFPAKDCAFHDKVHALFQKYAVSPKNGISSDHETMTRHFIRSGMGVSLLPDYMCRGRQAEGLFILEKEKTAIDLSYAYPEKNESTNETRIVLDALGKVWG